MARFIIKRFGNALLTIFIVITCTFFMIKLSPGNPFANEKTNEAAIKALEKAYNVDKNVILQYFDYIKNLILHQDFGLSFKNIGVQVNDLIFPSDGESGFWLSIKFGIIVFIIVTILGLLLGILAALNPNSSVDRAINSFTVIGITIPPVVTSPILVLVFSVILKIFPPLGWEMDFSHLFLPVLAL